MQASKQQRSKCYHSATILLLLTLLVATVASVPTSVLAQNSEVTTNMMNLNGNNHNKHSALNTNTNSMMMTKVKRSSNNDAQTGNANISALDKKSSPEIVPASFNAPPSSAAAQEELLEQQLQQQDISVQPTLTAGVYTLPTNNEIMAAVEAAAAAAALNQRELEQRQSQFYGNMDEMYDNRAEDLAMQPHKRGINSQQYLYDGLTAGYGGGNNAFGSNVPNDYYNPYLSAAVVPANDANLVAVPNGYWADDDAGVVYTDLQDLNDYMPAVRTPTTYRNKAYDNLQNILNSEAYLESAAAAAAVPLPLQYAANRYYATLDGDGRSKRNTNNKYNNNFADLRLKRDTKLTPADMLALVALVEAGERARQDNDDEPHYMPYADNYNKNYQATGYDYNAPIVDDAAEYAGAWQELNNNNNLVDYYGMPMNMETLPKYELPAREHKYANTQKYGNAGTKRFMVAKRKRSIGKFLNEPVAKPSIAYAGEKYF